MISSTYCSCQCVFEKSRFRIAALPQQSHLDEEKEIEGYKNELNNLLC
jgi:hypothetical protein